MKPLGLPDPRRIGPYRIFAQLGRGGMGRVFLAGAPDGRLVALKLVHAQHVEEPGFRERFRREVAASRRVSGAYTAPVVDADIETEIPWLVTVFVKGPSLREAIEAAGPFPADVATRLAAGLASALGEIHAAGLVHRDLKPSNVLLAADGPRVIDFGVARVADGNTSELTHTGWLVGSPGYMSPEQAESKPLTPASDVFSLGAVVYMACTGSEPFMGASTPATLYNVVHAEPDMAAVPEQLRDVIAACLAKDPAARPTPEEVLARIGDVPAVTRTWPEAVHALIAEQDDAVVTALRTEKSPDVAVVPLLPAEGMSGGTSGAMSGAGSESGPGSESGQGSEPGFLWDTPRPDPDSTTEARGPEGPTRAGAGAATAGGGTGGNGGNGGTGGGRRGRSRRVLTAVLAAAALTAGGTAAALVSNSGGSPSAADAPVSSSAASEISTGNLTDATTPSPAPSQSDSETTSAQQIKPSAGDDSGTVDSAGPTSTKDTRSKSSTSPAPACLSNAEALSLAKQKNLGSLPGDAKVKSLKCDDGWAAGELTSASVGNISAVYVYDGAQWTIVDFGTGICDGVIRGAPADVRSAVC